MREGRRGEGGEEREGEERKGRRGRAGDSVSTLQHKLDNVGPCCQWACSPLLVGGGHLEAVTHNQVHIEALRCSPDQDGSLVVVEMHHLTVDPPLPHHQTEHLTLAQAPSIRE